MWSGDCHSVPRIVPHSSQMLPLLHWLPLPAVRSSPMTKRSTILLPCCCCYANPHSSNSHSPPEEQRRQSLERGHWWLCCWMRPKKMKTNLLMQRLKDNKVLLTPSCHCFNYSNAKKQKERKKEMASESRFNGEVLMGEVLKLNLRLCWSLKPGRRRRRWRDAASRAM